MTRRLWVAASVIVSVAAVSGWLGWLIHVRVIAANYPLSWDEGTHSLFGLAIANDLRHGDLLGLAYDTYRQVYWPPIHSWLVGLAFLAFGERIDVARDVSLVSYILFPLVLVAAGRALRPVDDTLGGWNAAGAAGVLAVAIPACIPFATLAFIDLPALVILTLTLLAAFHAERSPERPRRRVLIALGILGAFFTKTNYGILLLGVFFFDALIDARWSPRRLRAARNLYVAVPILIIFVVWFAYPPKITATIRAMINTASDAGGMTLEGLLYYPRALLGFAGSPLVLGVLLAGVAAAWRDRAAPNVRLLLLVAVLQFLLAEVHHTKEDRHILPMLPAMLLLAGHSVARLVLALRRSPNPRVVRGVAMAGGALVVVLGIQLASIASRPFPRARIPLPPGAAGSALVERVRELTRGGQRALIVSAFDVTPEPPALDWQLIVDERLLRIEHSGGIGVVDRDRGVSAALARAPMPAPLATRIARVLGRSDSPATVRTVYGGLPERSTPDGFAVSIAETLRRDRPDVMIVTRSMAEAVDYPEAYFAPLLANPLLTLASTRVVESTRIDEYRVARPVAPASAR
ncbi:MAG TPA: hypothetical protein VM076_13860 [Gemmatimonadaceae bacterium]|nr:hypothetical protein [Gemmatimonadaceae bacterium]